MTQRQVLSNIRKAISEKKRLVMTVIHGSGAEVKETVFEPYVEGQDLYQHDFVWGYLEWDDTFYKFRLDDIKEVKISPKTFEVKEDVTYRFAWQEEHYTIAEGFENKFYRN